jgi:hypothetical protein
MTEQDLIWVASFDIGKINFSFYIEEMDRNRLKSLQKIPSSQRYNLNGTTTEIFSRVVDDVCMEGRAILFKNSNLTEGCVKGKYLDPETFHNMTDLLDEHKEYWDRCDTFIIEQQMSFGRNKINTMALKLGQHCFSYFALNYGRFKNIVEYPSYNKTQILGSEKTEKRTKTGKVSYKAIDKPARKKWSIKKAMDILEMRNDEENLKLMKVSKKKDDLADTLCQLQSWKILEYNV